MATPIIVAGVTAASGIAGAVVQRRAADAATDRAEYQARLQERQAQDELNVAKENARRKREDRNRYLARVALSQAASGFETDQGTPLEVLGDITNRLDEQIYDYTEAAMARVGQLRAGAAMSRYSASQIQGSKNMSTFGTLLKTGARAYSAYDSWNYRTNPNG